MFIIEGSDSLGKTTTAKRLVELANKRDLYPIRYSHMTRPPNCFNFKSDYLDLMSVCAVQDRFHLGGLVWHEEGTITDASLKWIEGQLASLGSVLVVFVSPPLIYPHILKKYKKDEMFSEEAMIKGNAKFRKLIEYSIVTDFTVSVSDPEKDAPGDQELERWIDLWFSRIAFVKEMGSC